MQIRKRLLVGILIAVIIYLSGKLAIDTIDEDIENAHINYNQGIQQ